MPTLRDVADLAEVSTATVSHVINNSRRITPETRARVERAIAEIGFVPNEFGQMLAKRRSAARREKQTNGTETAARPSKIRVKRASRDAKDASARETSGAVNAAPNQASEATFGVTPSVAISAHAHESGASANVTGATARALLRLIRAAQPISRAELARRLNVNRSTVTEIVRPLLDSGVLREDARFLNGAARAGRPPVGLSLRPERATFIGVNIGVRNSQVGAMTTSDETLAEESFDTPHDAETALAMTRAAVERVIEKAAPESEIIVGVSAPSPVDAARSKLLYAPHLDWRDVDIANALRETSDRSLHDAPIIVENDATAAAIYEARRRLRNATDGSWDDFILVRAGTGIGVGLVRGGEVYRGVGTEGGVAGEFGHMTIVAGGKPCACGNRGCWERYASARSAASLYAGDRFSPSLHSAQIRYAEVVARAEAGERRAQATLEQTGEYLGIGIANVITGLGVGRVVVSGRIVLGWRFIKDPLRAAVARTMAGKLTSWSVQAGEAHGSGLGGAIEVAIDQYLASLTAAVS